MKTKLSALLLALCLAPAFAAEASNDMRHRGPGYGQGPGRPGRPGYGPNRPGYPPPPPPPPSYRWECAAQNARGQRFYGVDFSRYWAEREAMNSCLRYSRHCRPIGCRTFR